MGRKVLVIVALVGVALVATATTTGANSPGFKTSRPAQLVPWTPGNGVVIDPIISTGDVVGGYQMSGIPDGLGSALLNYNQYYSQGPEKLWATIVMCSILGLAFVGLIRLVEDRLTRNRYRQASAR